MGVGDAGKPDHQALAAMAAASRRARERQDADVDVGDRRLVARSSRGPSVLPDAASAPASILAGGAPAAGVPRVTSARSVQTGPGRGRRQGAVSPVVPAVAVVALLAGGGLTAWAMIGSGPHSQHAPTVKAKSTPTERTHTPKRGTATTTSPTASTATPPTASGQGSSSAPVASSVSPASGAAGQTVVVTGRGLYSADGMVTVEIGGQAAPTACSSETTCTVTVPDLGPTPKRVILAIITASGTSNDVTFTYR